MKTDWKFGDVVENSPAQAHGHPPMKAMVITEGTAILVEVGHPMDNSKEIFYPAPSAWTLVTERDA